MLPADTLKLLIDKLDAARPAARVFHAGPEPAHVYYVQQPDGSLARTLADPGPLALSPADLDTAAAIAANDQNQPTAEVWYSRTGVRVVFGADRRHRATLPLGPSPQLAKLAEWDRAGRSHLSQADLVILLRTTFADCFPAHPQLLSAVRQVKTSKAADVNSQMQHGKVSLSKSTIAEMSGLNALPEEVTFGVPVFAAARMTARAGVRVALDPDPQQERFTLIVLPGQVEAALTASEDWLAARLRHELGELKAVDVPLFRGEP